MYAAEEMQKGADLDDLEPEDKLDAARRYIPVDLNLRCVQPHLCMHAATRGHGHIAYTYVHNHACTRTVIYSRILAHALATHHPHLLPKSLLESELEIFLGAGAPSAGAAGGGAGLSSQSHHGKKHERAVDSPAGDASPLETRHNHQQRSHGAGAGQSHANQCIMVRSRSGVLRWCQGRGLSHVRRETCMRVCACVWTSIHVLTRDACRYTCTYIPGMRVPAYPCMYLLCTYAGADNRYMHGYAGAAHVPRDGGV